jgi:hypothetical protein
MENRRSFLTKATLGLAAVAASSVPAASAQVEAGSSGLPGRSARAAVPCMVESCMVEYGGVRSS